MMCVAWHNPEQRDTFLHEWGIEADDPSLLLTQDANGEGCARTKNRAIQEAVRRGADICVIVDDDCFPLAGADKLPFPFLDFLAAHARNLASPAPVEMFATLTHPPSRGTPFLPENRTMPMPVAASVGFWRNVGDYDAASQLVHGARHPMEFRRQNIFGNYFPLSGMNLAFRPRDWLPWCEFIDVPRYDDIWMGWLWQKEAYRRGACFALTGPDVCHSRQSNVWANLRDEAKHAERNETLWRGIATAPAKADYGALREMLPV